MSEEQKPTPVEAGGEAVSWRFRYPLMNGKFTHWEFETDSDRIAWLTRDGSEAIGEPLYAIAKPASEPADGAVREALRRINALADSGFTPPEGIEARIAWIEAELVDEPNRPVYGDGSKEPCRNGHEVSELIIEHAGLVSRAALSAPASSSPAKPAPAVEAVREAVNAEREACAKLAESLPGQRGNSPEHLVGRRIALAIRDRAALAPAAGLDSNDIQLLMRLKFDNHEHGARPVIEGNQKDWDRAMRLSDLGYIAIEQVAKGGRLHITRLGGAAVTAFEQAGAVAQEGER